MEVISHILNNKFISERMELKLEFQMKNYLDNMNVVITSIVLFSSLNNLLFSTYHETYFQGNGKLCKYNTISKQESHRNVLISPMQMVKKKNITFLLTFKGSNK